jgi:hypothetical protein
MRERPYWERLLYTIFPTIKRVVNYILVLALRIFRSTVNSIRNQI